MSVVVLQRFPYLITAALTTTVCEVSRCQISASKYFVFVYFVYSSSRDTLVVEISVHGHLADFRTAHIEVHQY